MNEVPSRDGHPLAPLSRPLTREEVEVALAQHPPGWGDSLDHPAYAEDAILNPLASRPDEDEAPAEAEQDRR